MVKLIIDIEKGYEYTVINYVEYLKRMLDSDEELVKIVDILVPFQKDKTKYFKPVLEHKEYEDFKPYLEPYLTKGMVSLKDSNIFELMMFIVNHITYLEAFDIYAHYIKDAVKALSFETTYLRSILSDEKHIIEAFLDKVGKGNVIVLKGELKTHFFKKV